MNIFIIAICVSLASFVSAAHGAEPNGNNSARTSSKPLCGGKTEFSAFFAKYSESPSMQQIFTIFPLEKLLVVDSLPEPKEVVRLVERDKLTFPLVPNAKERKEHGLVVELQNIGELQQQVTMYKPGTDYLLNYHFKCTQGQWMLFRAEDFSL